MTIYVLTETYPSETHKYQMAFIHPRIKGYLAANLITKVISFGANQSYHYDGVDILSINDATALLSKETDFILMSHSPNLRHHLPFINKWDSKIKSLVIFFHGHESLPLSKYYPKPFSYDTTGLRKYLLHRIYDPIKLAGLRRFIKYRLAKGNTELIYVSEWFKNEASKCVGLNYTGNEHIHVINNGLNPHITEATYVPTEPLADFITIRPIDRAKCAINLIAHFAKNHPESKFHLYGKGQYFNHNPKPDNLEIFDKFLSPWEIPELLNHYRYALLPTYQDTQGVMMCEMASHGMPTVVSDIPICHEMLDEYPNTLFLSNDHFNCKLGDIPQKLSTPINRFSFERTIGKEISLLMKLLNK